MKFRSELIVGVAAVLVILCSVGVLSYRVLLEENADEAWVSHTHRVIETLDALLTDLIDAETGQRGFLLTGNSSYLQPYNTALARLRSEIDRTRKLTADNPGQQGRMGRMTPLIASKLAELRKTISLRQDHDTAASLAIVQTGEGKHRMDQIRALISQMKQEEEKLLQERLKRDAAATRNTRFLILVGYSLSFLFLFAAGLLIYREMGKRAKAEVELRRREEQINIRNAQLETANKELEAFCYSVSHDLRAPLRSIDGFSQAVIEDEADRLDDLGKSYLQRIRAATQRMGILIDDLLNLSRVTRAEISCKPTDLSEMALSVTAELRRQQPAREVELVVAPGLCANADPRLMRIVLENLLGNSWKFTSKREHARIEFGHTAENGSSAFFVRDNGAGFDPTYSHRLFGAFQRLHATSEFPGTGIGLATIQRIIQRHGGSVWAESAVDHGATFYFRLRSIDFPEEEHGDPTPHTVG